MDSIVSGDIRFCGYSGILKFLCKFFLDLRMHICPYICRSDDSPNYRTEIAMLWHEKFQIRYHGRAVPKNSVDCGNINYASRGFSCSLHGLLIYFLSVPCASLQVGPLHTDLYSP